jgi:F-box/leucine-rich repeat protein 14
MMNDSQVVVTVLPTFPINFVDTQYDSHFHHHHRTFLRNYRQGLRYQPYHTQLVSVQHMHHALPPPSIIQQSSRPPPSAQSYTGQTLLDLSSSAPITELSPKAESPEPEQESTHVSNLYPEVLALIFSYLNVRDKGRAAQVCVSWRDAAYHKSVWRGVEAKLHLRKANPPLFTSLGRRGIKRVQVLSMRRSLRDVVHGVPNVERLNLSGCYNVTDIGLAHAFASPLPTLTQLDLSLCKQVTDSSLGRIAQHLRNLETLELGGCCHVTNTGLLLIAWGLRKLRRLNLRSCWHVSDQGIGHLAGRGLQDDSDIDDDDAVVSMAAAVTHSFAPPLPEEGQGTRNLEYLGLQDCQRLTDESLRYIAAGLPKLKTINLSFCVSITDSGLRHLAKMSSLRELNLRACDNVTDSGLAHLSEGLSGSGGSCLTSLDVSFCDKIGDVALNHVAQGLFRLKTLSLSACRISDDGLAQIASSLPELEVLHIGQCNKVTDKGLLRIAENLKQLRAIDLYGCTRVSPAGLDRLLRLPRLQVLNLGLFHIR